MNEFLCAMCGDYYLITWLEFAFLSDNERFGVCSECANQ